MLKRSCSPCRLRLDVLIDPLAIQQGVGVVRNCIGDSHGRGLEACGGQKQSFGIHYKVRWMSKVVTPTSRESPSENGNSGPRAFLAFSLNDGGRRQHQPDVLIRQAPNNLPADRRCGLRTWSSNCYQRLLSPVTADQEQA